MAAGEPGRWGPDSPSARARAMAAGDRTLSRVTVDELRTMLREDVQAVVRAELESMGRRSSKAWPPDLRFDVEQPPMHSTAYGSDESHEDILSPRLQGGKDNPATQALLDARVSSRRISRDMYGDVDEVGAVSRLAGDVWPGMPQFLKNAFGSIDECLQWEEEKRDGCFARFVQGGSFQAFFALVIFANAAVMVYLADVAIDEQLEKLGGSSANESFEREHIFEGRAEIFFLSLYCIELFCKLVVHRLWYFWNEDAKWNWLDFLLILQSLTEIILTPLMGGGRGTSATWMRTLRLFRVAKVLRILRVIKFFTQLHLIVTCIVGSFLSLFWSVAVLMLLFLLFSLYFVSSTATYLQEKGSAADVESINTFFGSVTTCARTLFMTLTGGEDWNTFYFILQPMGAAGMVYCFFVAFSHIALLNIVTGIFVESALKIAEPDVHTKAQEEFNHTREYSDGLKRLLRRADKDHDRVLSMQEFQSLLQDGTLVNYLSFLGIDPIWISQNLEVLFKQTAADEAVQQGDDNGTPSEWQQQVSLHGFVEKCMQLRGNARSTDLHDLQRQVANMDKAVRNHIADMSRLHGVPESTGSARSATAD